MSRKIPTLYWTIWFNYYGWGESLWSGELQWQQVSRSFQWNLYIIKVVDVFFHHKVVEFMESKPPSDNNKPVHIINIDIQDNHEEATMGAFLICDLVAMVRLKSIFDFHSSFQ